MVNILTAVRRWWEARHMASSTAMHVAVLNRTSKLTDPEAKAMTNDLQTFASDHFAKVWGIDARLRFVSHEDMTSWKGAANLLLLDNSDEASALGYHDVTPEGLPLGKVFVATTLQYGGEPSATTAHELAELLGDPRINQYAYDDRRNMMVAYETADAVEADEFGFKVGKHLMSDFVTPAFFDPARRDKGDRFSYRGHVHQPFELAAGGYEILFDPRRGFVQNVKRDQPLVEDRPRVGSRRERRMNLGNWQRSID
jgi:hypothetical protein